MHPKKLLDLTNKQAADKLAEMEYAELRHLLKFLAERLAIDAKQDNARGNIVLSTMLENAAKYVDKASAAIDLAATVKPRVK
jgi:hypothetical protein